MKNNKLCVILLLLLLLLIIYKLKYKENFETIEDVHKKLKINGDFSQEVPEQQMIFKYINSNSKILEFGPNIGRSSLIANYKLKDKTQHLCIETIKDSCDRLEVNRDLNNMKFQIFNGAISNYPLYQRGWKTQIAPSKGYTKVNTKPLNYVLEKYKIKFNTIIADCEGCLVPILKDNETFLNNINLIILEHDFNNEEDINIFNNLMKKYNFKLVDKMLKSDKGCPGINWREGVKSDPIFVSVWKK